MGEREGMIASECTCVADGRSLGMKKGKGEGEGKREGEERECMYNQHTPSRLYLSNSSKI